MKKLALFGLVLALGALAATASADEKYAPTCGQNANRYAVAYSISQNNPGFHLVWEQNCGNGGTVEWELQYRDSSTNNTWQDAVNGNGIVIDNLRTTPSSEALQDVFVTKDVTPAPCGQFTDYRLRVFDAVGPTVTRAIGC